MKTKQLNGIGYVTANAGMVINVHMITNADIIKDSCLRLVDIRQGT